MPGQTIEGSSEPVIQWAQPATWQKQLSTELRSLMPEKSFRNLLAEKRRDWSHDDPSWLKLLEKYALCDVGHLSEKIAIAWQGRTVRVFHGCRTEDAGSYHRSGIRVHDREALVASAKRLVEAHPELGHTSGSIDQMVGKIDPENGRTGLVFVVLDARPLVEQYGHYVLYGSEYVVCLLPLSLRQILRSMGVPTVIEVDLPLRKTPHWIRVDLAEALLQEWTRQQINRSKWTAPIDFGFGLRKPIIPQWVIGHFHPAQVRDPWLGDIVRSSEATTCNHCREAAPRPE